MPFRGLNLDRKFWVGIAATIVASLLAAWLTWYLSRPGEPVIGYSVSTASIGNTSSVRSLVPSLSLRLGDVEVDSVDVHNVQIFPIEGRYDDAVMLAIDFRRPQAILPQHPGSNAPRILGYRVSSPSAIHSANCEKVSESSVKCTLRPVAPVHRASSTAIQNEDTAQSAYRIEVATTGGLTGLQVTTSGNFTFRANTERKPGEIPWEAAAVGIGTAAVLASLTEVLLMPALWRMRHRRRELRDKLKRASS